MTREEAIELLCAYGVPQDEKRFQEAIDMAIESLSAEHSKPLQTTLNGDLISRADAINTLETEKRCTDREEDVSGLTLAKLLISALPSAGAVQGDECDHCVYKWGTKGGDDK